MRKKLSIENLKLDVMLTSMFTWKLVILIDESDGHRFNEKYDSAYEIYSAIYGELHYV